jgi:hypothetical protein
MKTLHAIHPSINDRLISAAYAVEAILGRHCWFKYEDGYFYYSSRPKAPTTEGWSTMTEADVIMYHQRVLSGELQRGYSWPFDRLDLEQRFVNA